jgi:amino acid transporter
MEPPTAADSRRVLSTGRVVFLVIAAAAPMGAVVGNIPLAIVRGNGAGLPAAFLLATVTLLCFSIGYAAMGRRIVNSGAFYTFIARGLGRTAGLCAAYVGVVSYTALACGLVASFGYFVRLVLLTSGLDLPWGVYSALAIVVVAFLGFRSVDFSAKLLGVLMVGEFAVLLVFDATVAVHRGVQALPADAWSSHNVLTSSLGIGLMFAFVSFVGFESAALYGEETTNPERSIPRAIFVSVISIGVFYVFTSWLVVGASGVTRARALRTEDLGNLLFDLIKDQNGEIGYDLAAVLLCTSVLASLLAIHNAASRYLFALGREQVLPAALGRYHPRHLSPHLGSLAVSAVSIVVVGAFGLAGADPYLVAASSLVGLGTLGIIALQAAASAAVIAFFWTRRDRELWRAVVAPGIGLVGLAGGVATASLLRRHRPSVWATVASSQLRPRTHPLPEPPAYQRKYCLVGAGPAGLIMARSLMQEGVPFDWFERHSDVGGSWDMDNPGSPMYESAHFISSRYTSGFYGFPMSADLPDYPSWRQVRDYIRDFATTYGLYERVTLSTAVTRAEPLAGDRWSVTVSTGQTREYDGLIVAPGVTWHASEPVLQGIEGFHGTVRHAVTFRTGLELRGKRVLVVGAGNSGVDIAIDAARHAEQAFLSVRRGYRFVPKHLFGLPTDAVLTGLLPPPRGVSLSGNPNDLVDTLVGDLTRLGLPEPDHDLLTSHPIMNTQVLHHLAHGDLIAKPDVQRLNRSRVEFVDGTSEQVDEVILATGYSYAMPFLDHSLFEWTSGHPKLYLNIFSRTQPSLYILGFVEFADAAYKRFDEMAQLILIDLRARETGHRHSELHALKLGDQPDPRGGVAYIDSPRHANYVNSAVYQAYLAELRDRFDWPDLDHDTYSALRSTSSRTGSR